MSSGWSYFTLILSLNYPEIELVGCGGRLSGHMLNPERGPNSPPHPIKMVNPQILTATALDIGKRMGPYTGLGLRDKYTEDHYSVVPAVLYKD